MLHPKVLLIVGDATETVDTLYPFYRLIEGGYTPVVAAPEKRKYQMVLHEVKPGWTITKEWEGYSIDADIAFKDINPEEYVGIFFSGGRAPEYIREDAGSAAHHQVVLGANGKALRQRLPRRGDPRARRYRERPAHGHGGEVQVRPRNLRRHLCQRTLCDRSAYVFGAHLS